MKDKYLVSYDCGCNYTEEIVIAEDLDAADDYAHSCAFTEYESYVGLHCISDAADIAVEIFADGELPEEFFDKWEFWDTLTDEQIEEADLAYTEEIENSISYSAKLATEEDIAEWEEENGDEYVEV